MPGIYGQIASAPTKDAAQLLERMALRLRHHDWYKEDRHVDAAAGLAVGRTALGFVNTASQPASNEDGSLLAMLEGEIYDAAALRRQLEAAGHRFRTEGHAELLLHGFEEHGRDFLLRVHGCFVAALWQARQRRLVLTSDRFGMKPLYYTQLPGRLLFASELKALLADPEVSRRPSLRGLAQFFTFGQLLGDDTLVEGIAYLPAAAWLTFDAAADNLQLDHYWKLEAGRVATNVSIEAALDRLDAAFKQAVDRCTVGTRGLGLSLSGGLDARTILAVLDTQQTPVVTVCLGMPGSIDRRAAEQMARLAGCPHQGYVLDAQFTAHFEGYLRRLVHLTDGHYLSQCVTVPTLPLYRDLGIEVLLRGHAGELMHLGKAYNFSVDRQALQLQDGEALESWLMRRLSAFVSPNRSGPLFARGQNGVMQELAADSLRDCLTASAGTEPVLHRIWHLFITQRLRRETALSLAEFGSVTETRLPYLDPELVDALFAVPPTLKLDETIQAHILRKRRPAFLRIVNANTGARLEAGRWATRLAGLRMKLLARLGAPGYQPYERLGLWLRRELRPLVQRLLLQGACLELGVFNPDTIRAVVHDHISGRENHTFLILALLIFEVGQRELLDGGLSEGNQEPVAAS